MKKQNHESVPFGYRGVLSNCLISNFTTHVTTILVCVYEYTCSVALVTLGNKGQGTLRGEVGTDGGRCDPIYPVLVLLYWHCNRLARKTQSG